MARRIYSLILVLLGVGSLFAREWNYSIHSDRPEVYLDAIASGQNQDTADTYDVRAGIVPHHFLASSMIVEFFEGLKNRTNIRRILVFGPDHFQKSEGIVSVSDLPWKTPFGSIESDRGGVMHFQRIFSNSNYDLSFSGEHSVGVQIPFIKYYFPRARVIPLLIRGPFSERDLSKLKEFLGHYLGRPDTLVILSMDFSHYKPLLQADEADRLSKEAILSFAVPKSVSLDMDCPKGFGVLMDVLRSFPSATAQILRHTNSAHLLNDLKIKSTTSYFSVYFRVPKSKNSSKPLSTGRF